jgi:hypothetical protein
MDNKDAFVQKFSAKLEEWTSDFKKLKAHHKGAYAESHLKCSGAGKTTKIEAAKIKLKKFEDSGDDHWDDFKADKEKTWIGLQNSIYKTKMKILNESFIEDHLLILFLKRFNQLF